MKISTNYQVRNETPKFKGNLNIVRLPLVLEPNSDLLQLYGKKALKRFPTDIALFSGLDKTGKEILISEVKKPDGTFLSLTLCNWQLDPGVALIETQRLIELTKLLFRK